ncbi:MAG: DUF1499 domain-containing protein [Gammaproteobacteria bacterium]|nr:DUF1499 domain-containing protein [Gammaproteobacteria bacterium]
MYWLFCWPLPPCWQAQYCSTACRCSSRRALQHACRPILATMLPNCGPMRDFPELRPAVYPIEPALLCQQVTSALEFAGLEWQALAGDCHYHAIVTTPLLGFKDDVRIGVEPVGDSSSHLTIHSGSRVGRGDMGANIRHVLDLVRAVERQ